MFLDKNEGSIFSVIGGSLAGGLIGFAFFFIPSLLTCYFFIKTIGIYKKSTHEKLCSMVGFLSCLIWSYIFGFEKAENILFHPLSFGVVGAITAFIVAKILNRPEKRDICR